MKRILIAMVICGAATSLSFQTSSASATEITGAGSTFVYPVIAKWADTYKKKTGISVNYQAIGSGGGIKQIENKTVDFGASDMPLKTEELEKNGLVQFPIINGADVAVVHLAGVKPGEMKLTGPMLADIFLGKIKKWNDSQIAALNPNLKLPDKAISVVHRADGSGTTFIWTNYLSKVSPEWKSKVGEGTAVNWPTGVGGKGNEGVASFVKQINGSIGYVEYAYAVQNHMSYTSMKNSAGHFVEPDAKTFKSAAAGAEWAKAKNFYLIMTNAPGKNSWPIAGSTFILMQKTQENPAQAKAVLRFFNWAYLHGVKAASELYYVPIPGGVAKLIEKSWKAKIKSANGAPVAVGL